MKNKIFIKIQNGKYVTYDKRFIIQNNDFGWEIYRQVKENKYETTFKYCKTLTIAKDIILRTSYNTSLWSVQHTKSPIIKYNGAII